MAKGFCKEKKSCDHSESIANEIRIPMKYVEIDALAEA